MDLLLGAYCMVVNVSSDMAGKGCGAGGKLAPSFLLYIRPIMPVKKEHSPYTSAISLPELKVKEELGSLSGKPGLPPPSHGVSLKRERSFSPEEKRMFCSFFQDIY
jgi:hypothetical protein